MPRKRPVVAELERFYTTYQDDLQRAEERIVLAGISGGALAVALEPQRSELRSSLGHLDFCLKLVEPSWSADRLTRIRRRQRASELPRRRLLGLAYDVLRSASQPLSTREIMALSERRLNGLTAAQARSHQHASALTTLLRGQEAVGAVRAFGKRPLRWAIIRGPE